MNSSTYSKGRKSTYSLLRDQGLIKHKSNTCIPFQVGRTEYDVNQYNVLGQILNYPPDPYKVSYGETGSIM